MRDKCPLVGRAAAVGVKMKEPSHGKKGANMRAGGVVLSKEEVYLATHPVLPPNPASPPPDAPGAMHFGVKRAPAFGRPAGEFALGTFLAFRETSLDATDRKG